MTIARRIYLEKQVIKLSAQMAKFTHDICVEKCNPQIKWACCAEMHCHETINYAREMWGVSLQITEHDRLPLLGPDGCTAAPHLRPICTVHLCEKFIFGNLTLNEEYFALRDKLNEALMKWMDS